MDEIQWQLAGLCGDGNGLTRPVRTSDWKAPARVDLDGYRLRWQYDDGSRIRKTIRAGHGLVDAFVKLADANPEDIRDFARRWGVLLICEHDKPAGHSFPRELLIDALNAPEKSGWCAPLGSPDECWEPLGSWYTLAREARAMLNVAAALHNQKLAKRGDWHMLVYRVWPGPDRGDPALDIFNQPRYAAGARACLADSVNRWLAWGAVQPRLTWSGRGSPTIDFEGSGLFGALAVQILAAVNRRGWAFCSECSNSYNPGRRPNPNRKNYCPDCREKGVPSRNSSSASRRRQDRQKKEHRR